MEPNHRSAHVEPVALLRRIEGAVGEDPVADLLVVRIERLDRIEVAVDDHVEKAVDEEADPEDSEFGRSVPPLEHWMDREPVVLADGDEPAVVDERIDLRLIETATLDVDAHSMARQEQMRCVPVELGTLVRFQGVFDGKLVQPELSGQLVKLFPRRA